MLNMLTLRQLKQALEETRPETYTLFKEAAYPEQWSDLRQNKKYSAFWDGLQTRAAHLLENPIIQPPFSDFTLFGDTGDRNIYAKKRNELYSRLDLFALLSMAEEKAEWKKGLEDAIWSICNEYTWVLPAHVGLYVNQYPNGIWDQPLPPRETVDLDASTTAFTLAEILHALGNRLHPWVVARAKAEIERRIFQVVFESPYSQNWELKTNNWPAVCASNIGAAAIYLIEDSEKLAGMLWRVIGVLRQYLSGFDEQGATPEGPAYWQYGFSHFVYFAELLRERTDGRITLLTEKKVEKISQFPQFCLLSGGKVINFSDSPDEVRFHTGVIQRLRSYFESISIPPEQYRLNEMQIQWLSATRQMFWSSDNSEFDQDAARVQERIFTGNQWVISKVQQADGTLAAFAAKGGYNEEPHNHNDLGHFILHVNGVNVLADIGIGIYSRQYFQPEYRYEMINAGSQGHSVPIIDGFKQGFGKQYRTELLKEEIKGDEVHFTLDLSQAYSIEYLQRLTREFIWLHPEHERTQLIITDKVAFERSPSSFQEVFICGVLPQLQGNGRVVMNEVTMTYDSDQWDAEVETVSVDSYLKAGNLFYRLILNRKELNANMECQFRFEISE